MAIPFLFARDWFQSGWVTLFSSLRCKGMSPWISGKDFPLWESREPMTRKFFILPSLFLSCLENGFGRGDVMLGSVATILWPRGKAAPPYLRMKGRKHRKNLRTPWLCWILLCKNFFFLFRAAPAAYGGSQARGRIRAVVAGLHHSHSNTGSEPHLPPYTTVHSNTGSSTHWTRPGIEPVSSWVHFHWTMMGSPLPILFMNFPPCNFGSMLAFLWTFLLAAMVLHRLFLSATKFL